MQHLGDRRRPPARVVQPQRHAGRGATGASARNHRRLRPRRDPPFNQDDEHHPPAKVVELKRRVRAADALLFLTPEYNYSIPGVLENAIDWASRPYGDENARCDAACLAQQKTRKPLV